MSGPSLLPEEEFEDFYTAKFDALLRGRGLKVQYTRDRAATDVGVMWKKPDSLELTGVRVWFQLKGKHAETTPAEKAQKDGYAPIKIDVEHLRFWYAAPEATYLVLYLESMDVFLARDVRDIVDEKWGPGILAPENLEGQETVTIHMPLDAVLDEAAVERISRAHRSMRIDGPTFRGRPLGHRFDPLRSELNPLEPEAFEALVSDVLDAHLLRGIEELDARRLVRNVARDGHRIRLLTGTLWTTYEYVFAGSVELGFGPRAEPRNEGQTFTAIGKVAVVIHSRVGESIEPADGASVFIDQLVQDGYDRFLVFANCNDFDHHLLYPWRREILSGRCNVPQGLRSLAYNVLMATLVYLDNVERLSWKDLPYHLGEDVLEVAEHFHRMASPFEEC